VAEKYLDAAELMAEELAAAAGNVVVGVAVLAGIAAGDAICCARLGGGGFIRRGRLGGWRTQAGFAIHL